MIAFALRRLVQSIAVLLVTGLIAFSMFRYVGDPVSQILPQEYTEADRIRVTESLGLNDPFPIQYLNFLGRAVQGDFGISYQHNEPALDMILERLPATLELAIVSAGFAVLFGIVFGVYTALRRDGIASNVFMTASLIGVSLPTFLIGILLIWIFAVELRWLPPFGRGETVDLGWWRTGFLTTNGLKSLILPGITLGLYQMTLVMRLVRAEMLEVLRADYIRFAWARGLKARSVHFGHALKNTLVPVITIIGLQFGAVVAFAIITETVFQWPGVGFLFINAVEAVNIPIMITYLMMVALFFVTINFVVDLLYFMIDPRLRT